MAGPELRSAVRRLYGGCSEAVRWLLWPFGGRPVAVRWLLCAESDWTGTSLVYLGTQLAHEAHLSLRLGLGGDMS